jgi:uncharacterized membrane protein
MLTANLVIGFPLISLVGQPQLIAWLIILVSGLIDAVYCGTLTRAYAAGDLSQVYPITRCSALLFVLLWALLFLGERPTPIGVGGIVIIVIGLYLVNLPSTANWKRPLLGLTSPVARWALLTGLLISIYSAIDKVGVRYVDPLPYLYLFLVVTWIALSAQWLNPDRRAALRLEVQIDRRRVLLAAALVATGIIVIALGG